MQSLVPACGLSTSQHDGIGTQPGDMQPPLGPATRRTRPSSPWPRTTATAATGSPARPTSSSRATCPSIPPTRARNSFRKRRRVQDLPAGHALHRATAHAFHPLQHRPDSGPGERRRARPEPGAGTGRLHQPGRGAQPHPEHPALSGPLPDSPGHRPDRRRPPARSPAPLPWPPACRCAASSSASAR